MFVVPAARIIQVALQVSQGSIGMLWKRNNVNTRMHSAQDRMQKYAKEIAANMNAELSYGPDSMVVIDKIIDKLAKELTAEKIPSFDTENPSAVAQGYVETFGCYIVEVIERNYGKGIWDDHDEHGPVFKFTLNNGTVIYPMQWCAKKLANPSSYSIHEVYEQFVVNK